MFLYSLLEGTIRILYVFYVDLTNVMQKLHSFAPPESSSKVGDALIIDRLTMSQINENEKSKKKIASIRLRTTYASTIFSGAVLRL